MCEYAAVAEPTLVAESNGLEVSVKVCIFYVFDLVAAFYKS